MRDEAELLSGCLESAREAANQLVVVDTGSQDDTVQIAQSFGAEVYHFDRIDDFAAA